MTILTIPKEYSKKELVLIPRDEYGQLVDFRATHAEEEMNPAAQKVLIHMRRNRITWKLVPFRSK